MLLNGANASTIWGTHHQRTGITSPRPAPVARGVAPQLMKRLIDEAQELDLTDRLEAVQCHTDRCSNDSGLRQRCVDDAIGAETFVEPFGGPKHTAVDAD